MPPMHEMCEMYLANGWQLKENCPGLKPGDASTCTFGRVIEKVFPSVMKTKRLSAVCESFPPDRSFPSWSLFTLNYSHREWLKSSASANGEEFVRVVPFFATLECNDGKLKSILNGGDWL